MLTLGQLLLESAGRDSNRIALIEAASGQELTYGQLQDRVEVLAGALQAHNLVNPGDRVGILLYNTPEFVIGFFALQWLGAVVVPLSYRLTGDELATIGQDAGMRGLLSSTEFAAQTGSLLAQLDWLIQVEDEPVPKKGVCPIYTLSGLAGAGLGHWPGVGADRVDTMALLIYTSGTTGKPKGVMLSHRNLMADALANIAVIEAVADDRFITASPLFHIFGLTNILLTAAHQGAAIVLLPRFNPRHLLECIGRYGVTFLAAVPTMYQMMLALLPNDGFNLASLRVCHSGAAPMPREVFHQVEALFGAPVQEGYGQSEASSIVTSNPLHGARKPGSIGLPLQGMVIEIVDEADQVLPPQEIGELRLKGDNVMLGYYNNPEVTKRVIRNGWLYTRDMGYRDEAGYIFLVDRRDDLINVGGNKVYPREVEEVLYQHPLVKQCAVTAEPSEIYHQVVAAYVVTQPGRKADQNALCRHCKKHLAKYKVPKTFYFVEEIPTGATGKVLRHRLSAPNSAVQPQ